MVGAMRWLVAIAACAACKDVTTTANRDAAIDSPPRPDSLFYDAAPPPDAYAPRACDAPPTFADGLVPSRILHVVPGASNGDGSTAAPFGSIAAAAAVATPGTWIKLAPGTHAPQQFIANLRGTATAPIWIGGEYPDQPEITGGLEGLHLTRPAYVVLQNLDIGSQSGAAINIDDGVAHAGDTTHVALVNIYAHDLGTDGNSTCIRVAGVDNLSVYDSRVRRCTRGIDLVGVHAGVVARTRFIETYTKGLSVRGGSTDVDIRQNRVDDGGTMVFELGGVTPYSQFRPALSPTAPNAEAYRVRAFNNFVTGYNDTTFVFNTCVDCVIAHNYSGESPSRWIRIAQETPAQDGYTFEPSKNGRVINNTFQRTSGTFAGTVDVDPLSTGAGTFTFSHNLWQTPPTLPVTEDGQLIGFSGYSSADPSQLCGGSEVNAAAPMPEIDGTFDGTCRAEGDAPAIGPGVLHLAGCTLVKLSD